MTNKILLAVCFLFIFTNSNNMLAAEKAVSTEQDAIPLSLDLAWDMMVENNKSLHKLYMEWGAAERKANAYDQWLPSLSAGASVNRSSPFISQYSMPSESLKEESEFWSLRGALDMQLKIAPGLSIEEELRQLKADLLHMEIAAMIRSLKYNLTVLYYEILASEKRIALQQENLRLAEQRLQQTEIQYEQGLKSDLELLSAKIAAARDIPSLQKEQTSQEKRYITLRNYLDLEESALLVLSPEISENEIFPDRETVFNMIPSNLDILMLENRIRQAELNYDLAKRKINGPTLGLSMGWSSSLNPAFEEESWTSEEWRDNLNLGLSLTLPLDGHMKGSSDQLNLKELDEAIESARISLNEAVRSLKDDIRTLYLDIELSRSNIRVNELNVSLLEQNYLKMEQNYMNGRTSLMTLNDSRQDLEEAHLSLEDEKLNLTILTTELMNLLNLP